jgi:hypothetical protein
MLTRCPSCSTPSASPRSNSRHAPARCAAANACFNALDSLIEEPVVVTLPAAAVAVPPTPTFWQMPPPGQHDGATSVSGNEAERGTDPANPADGIAVPSAPALHDPSGIAEPVPEALEELPGLPPATREEPAAETPETTRPEAAEADATESAAIESGAGPVVETPATEPPAGDEPAIAETDAPAAATAGEWSTAFPEPPPPPRRWPWVIGSVVALAVLALQAVVAFRVELAVLWPESKPALVALCEIADCEVGLPAKVGLVGIEASELHPDSEHQGRLALAATLKNRAPFAQQFPHLEITLTDTADQAIARKVLAPADYLPPATAVAGGMKPNADIMVALGIDSSGMAASGYRLYLFYP